MARVPESASSQTWMVEGHKQQRTAVMVARAVVTPTGTGIPLRLLNWRNEPVSISKGTAIADLEPVYWEQTFQQRQWLLHARIPRRFQRSNAFVYGRWSARAETASPKKRKSSFLLSVWKTLTCLPRDQTIFGRTTALKHKIDTKS